MGYAATGIASQLTAEHVAVQPGVLVVHSSEERWLHAIHISEFLRLNQVAGIVHLLNTFTIAGGCSNGVTLGTKLEKIITGVISMLSQFYRGHLAKKILISIT
jgi:hypothetical protein